jgi:phage terminase small subunit
MRCTQYIFYAVEASNSGIVSSYCTPYSVLLKAEGVLGKESISLHRLDKSLGLKSERFSMYWVHTKEYLRTALTVHLSCLYHNIYTAPQSTVAHFTDRTCFELGSTIGLA